MSDRLSELRRQRALVQAQADWLDREIAACGGSGPAAGAKLPTAASESPPPVGTVSLDESIYTPDPVGASQRAKRGCFLYFALILALLGATFLVFYYARYRDRPLIFMEKDGDTPGNAQAEH